jgi:MurNAc alpha-1-phosphate uridylyltransferase
MVLAAGLGTRMRPITDRIPKPLVEVAGRTLLDHVLDHLAGDRVELAVVNVHHLAHLVEAHLTARDAPPVRISDERAQLMDSGGGVRRALPWLGGAPFYVMNADSFWVDDGPPNLARMRRAWDAARMDILLLTAPLADSVGYHGAGDYRMDAEGRLTRRGAAETAPFVYAGAAIMRPSLFAGTPEEPFSLNRLFDAAERESRLFGLPLEGLWLHVGTPDAIAGAEAAIRARTG